MCAWAWKTIHNSVRLLLSPALRCDSMPPHLTHTHLPEAPAASLPRVDGRRRGSPAPARRAVVTAAAKPKPAAAGKKTTNKETNVSYGASWYEATRNPTQGRTVAQELARRKAANWEANGRKRDREDLYTASAGGAWEGSEFVGSSNNILTWLIVASVAAPLAGLAFAYWSYGTLWG